MNLLNRVLLAGMVMALTSCTSHRKTLSAPANHQWNVAYPAVMAADSGVPITFLLDFNDELGLLRVTVSGPEQMFGKGNIGARWHGFRGDILDPTQSSLDKPGSLVSGATTNWAGAALFSTQAHLLDDGWMEVMIGQDWYWLEVPSGIALCPGTPPDMAVPRSNPGMPSGVGQMTAKDHIMRWEKLVCANLRVSKAGPGYYWTNQTPPSGERR